MNMKQFFKPKRIVLKEVICIAFSQIKILKLSLIIMLIFALPLSHKSLSQIDTLDIYNLSLDQLSELKIISASKVPQKIIEIPSAVFVITADEIQEKGYFTLEDALANLPGFQFRDV